MRLATISGRAALVVGSGAIDVEVASDGRFCSDAQQIYQDWSAFVTWAEGALEAAAVHAKPFVRSDLGPPSPRPRQVFAIGLNYQSHVAESGLVSPGSGAFPSTFTKFPTCLTGPDTVLFLPNETVDWEVELVVVIGREADTVSAADAWSYVAGVTVGQDYSQRDMQRAGPIPQFSMSKSFAGFGPTGPWLVTPDELDDPDDLALECSINGETVQQVRTSHLINPVPDLIEQLSAVTVLLPGDIIFTGTPSGVGVGRTPERYLVDGDVVVSTIEGIGSLHQTCTTDPQPKVSSPISIPAS